MSRTPLVISEEDQMPCNNCNSPNSCAPVCPSIDLKSFLLGAFVVVCAEVFAVSFVAFSGKLFN